MKFNLCGSYMDELERIGFEKGWIKEATPTPDLIYPGKSKNLYTGVPVDERSRGVETNPTHQDTDNRKTLEERHNVPNADRKWIDIKIGLAQSLINTYYVDQAIEKTNDPNQAKKIKVDNKWGKEVAENWNFINKEIDGKFDFVNAVGKVPPTGKELDNMIFVMKSITKGKGTVIPKTPTEVSAEKESGRTVMDFERGASGNDVYKKAESAEEVVELENLEAEISSIPNTNNWVRLKIDNGNTAYNKVLNTFYDYELKTYWKLDPHTLERIDVPAPAPAKIKSNVDVAVQDLQRVLNWKFGQKLSADGVWGPKTQASWKNIIKTYGLDIADDQKPSNEEMVWVVKNADSIVNSVKNQKADEGKNEQAKEMMLNNPGITATKALEEVSNMADDNKPVIDELVNLANDLDEMGEVKAAIAVDNQLKIYKEALDKLYDVTGETGESFIGSAHKDHVTIAPSKEEGGKVENVVEQQKKDIEVATKNPTGKYAATIQKLIATANKLEDEGMFDAAEMVDRSINELLKKSPFQDNGLVAATNTVVKKNAALDPRWEMFWDAIEPQMFALAPEVRTLIDLADNNNAGQTVANKLDELATILESGRANTDLVRKMELFSRYFNSVNLASAFGMIDETKATMFKVRFSKFVATVKKFKSDMEGKIEETDKNKIVAPYMKLLLSFRDAITNMYNMHIGVFSDEELSSLGKEISQEYNSFKQGSADLGNLELTNKKYDILKRYYDKFQQLLTKKTSNKKYRLTKVADLFETLSKLDKALPQTQKNAPSGGQRGGHGGGGHGGGGGGRSLPQNEKVMKIQMIMQSIHTAGADVDVYLGDSKKYGTDGRWGRLTQSSYDKVREWAAQYGYGNLPQVNSSNVLQNADAVLSALEDVQSKYAVAHSQGNAAGGTSAGAGAQAQPTTPGAAPGAAGGGSAAGTSGGGSGLAATTSSKINDFVKKVEILRSWKNYLNSEDFLTKSMNTKTEYPIKGTWESLRKMLSTVINIFENDKEIVNGLTESSVGMVKNTLEGYAYSLRALQTNLMNKVDPISRKSYWELSMEDVISANSGNVNLEQ